MKLNCFHGYFIFSETKIGQISDFMSLTGFTLVSVDDYYTFESLETAPSYSLKGHSFMGTTALETFEGKPWKVFEANGLIYDFGTDSVKLISTIVKTTQVRPAGNRFTSPGLILPGSFDQYGDQITGYQAFFNRDKQQWLYSEVRYG